MSASEEQIQAYIAEAEKIWPKVVAQKKFKYPKLADVFKTHLEKKEWMCNVFEFDKHYRNTRKVKQSSTSLKLADVFLNLVELRSKYIRTEDPGLVEYKKNRFKIGKVLPEIWPLIVKSRKMNEVIDGFDLREQLGFEDIVHRFSVKYGDYIKGERLLIFSINPVDFLFASANAAFKSCVRPDGEYFNTIIHKLCSDCVAITYTSDPAKPQYKHGRMWCYISPTGKKFWTGRYYGAYFEQDSRIISDMIIEALKLDGSKLKVTEHLNPAIVQKPSDTCYLDFAYGTTFNCYKSKDYDPATDMFKIGGGICLKCGNDLGLARGELCEPCAVGSVDCHVCGESTPRLSNRIVRIRQSEQNYVCQRCWDEHTTNCHFCGHRYLKRIGVSAWLKEGKKLVEHQVCPYCKSQYTLKCNNCGRQVHTDAILQHYEGGWRCEDCYDYKHTCCSVCGCFFGKGQGHGEICKSCNEKYIKCECGWVRSRREHKCAGCGERKVAKG